MGALLWSLLLVAGQGAILALVSAGPRVGYQHLPPVGESFAAAPRWALALLAVQALVVAVGLWRQRGAVGAALGALGRWRALALAAALASTGATLSPRPALYAAEVGFALLLALVQLATVVLFVLAAHRGIVARIGSALERWLGGGASESITPGGLERWVWGAAATAAALAALLAAVAFQRHPHVPDEVAYLLQARTFAAGRLALPVPQVPEAFETYLMWARDGRWFSVFPPGWPALLALGVVARVPWLVNPLFAGLNVLLVFLLLRELLPLRGARLATMLFALAPWNLFLAMSFMAHTSALTVALTGALAMARLRRARRAAPWALLAGAAIGLLALFRPLEMVIVGALLGPWALAARGRRWRFSPALLVGLGAAAAGSLTLPYNRHFTGSAHTFPVMAYMDATFGPGSNALGFGAARGAGWSGADPFPGHGPLDAAINANLNLFAINVDLFGWATGSLVAIFLALLAGRPDGAARRMLLAIAAVVGAQSLYWFSGGPDFGARYWYLAIVPCVVLAARGIESVAGRAAGALPRARERVAAAVALLCFASLGVFVPWRAIDKYRHYRGMRPDLRQLAADRPWRDALVLVRGWRHPDYASAAVYNPLDFAAPAPVFVWDRGGVRSRLVAAFPKRSYWLVDGPTASGDGYRVVAGPLTASELLALPEPAAP